MTPEPTDTEQPGVAADGQGRLEAEHDLDQAALARTLPDGEEAPTEPLPAPAAPAAATAPPPVGGLRRRTRLLLGVLVGGLLFLAGIQCQKLVGAGAGPPGAQPPAETDTDTSTRPGAPAPRIVQGEIVAVRASTLYVREADGDIVRMRAAGASRVFRGQPDELRSVRPGEAVVAELQPGDGEATAISLTVLPARERSP